jgi:hexosaminidase
MIACFEKSPWSTYSHQPPPGQLRFASEAATEFTKAIFESTLDLVRSQYFGTGGDEINEKCMVCPHARFDGKLEDEETIESLRVNGWTLDEALNEFTAKTHQPILGRSKTPLVWQEMVCSLLFLNKI